MHSATKVFSIDSLFTKIIKHAARLVIIDKLEQFCEKHLEEVRDIDFRYKMQEDFEDWCQYQEDLAAGLDVIW
jgi:hypothetical protein